MGKSKKYFVEKALQLRYNKATKEKEYLIKWENYLMRESTWEPVETLKVDCPSIMKDYMQLLEKVKK
jgi:hypothetical protein